MVRLILLTVTAFLFSCKSGDLILPQRDLNAGMRLDGYYYRSFVDQVNGKLFTNILFLYKNGVVFDCFNVDSHDVEDMDEYIRKEFGGEYDKSNNRLNWGIVVVDESIIKVEQWYPSSGGPMPVRIRSGVVLDDTTFRFTESTNQKGKDRETLDQTYHFRQFSPKPDSTNNFVK